MTKKVFFALTLSLVLTLPLAAQDFGFGFGDDADTGSGGGSAGGLAGSFAPAVSISGEVTAEILGYVKDFSDGPENVQLGDIFSGKLNFAAGNAYADAVINLKIAPAALPEESPFSIDEAYVRTWLGDLEIEGGLRKLTWGKADSLGPLDVINPLDYSELTDLSNIMNLKIARPMVHLSYRVGSFSKIEGVFIPTFQPMRYATEGRWAPAQMAQMSQMDALVAQYFSQYDEQTLAYLGIVIPTVAVDSNLNTSTLNYAQGGLRFTTTIGPADIGFQYYYGRLTSPAYDIVPTYTTSQLVPSSVDINFMYNPYHQIGIDWAQVLFGFNIRTEFALNLTEDLKGDDPSVYNPNIAWSLGFDRDLVWGINLNIQCNETIRLMHNKISDEDFFGFKTDIEAGSNVTSTQIIVALTKSFFMDQLAFRIAGFVEIEDKDFLLIPSLIWTRDAIAFELSGGIFGGDKKGQFGQYYNNNFVKVGVTYSF